MIKKWFRLLCACIVLTSCNTKTNDPVIYDQQITELITQIDITYEQYNQTKQSTSIDNLISLTQAHKQTIASIISYRDTLKQHPPFSDHDSYRTIAINYANNILSLLQNEETQLISLYTEVANYPDTERTPDIERSYKQKQTTIINAINDQIQTTNRTMLQAQEAFANEHHLTLSGTAIE